MKIVLSFSKIYIFRCSYYTYGYVSTISIEKKRIEEFVIMNEEVKMKPKRVC
jgi:hypothetical protein